MKKYIIMMMVAVVGSFQLFAQFAYTPVDSESKAEFTIKNFGIKVNGHLSGFKGTIHFDVKKPESGSIDVSLDANSINTDNNKRDNHLRKEEYFDVEKFKTLHYKSVTIKKLASADQYHVEGTLTIKGVSKPVGFDFTAVSKNGGYLFEGEFEINRRDFGVGGGSISMADELQVTLSVFAK
jgi:polyisoprenoid-binding protein YceI